MSKVTTVCTVAALVGAVSITQVHADQRRSTLAIVMTNDVTANHIQVYDAATGTLLQALSTFGRGGVSGNARGVRQVDD